MGLPPLPRFSGERGRRFGHACVRLASLPLASSHLAASRLGHGRPPLRPPPRRCRGSPRPGALRALDDRGVGRRPGQRAGRALARSASGRLPVGHRPADERRARPPTARSSGSETAPDVARARREARRDGQSRDRPAAAREQARGRERAPAYGREERRRAVSAARAGPGAGGGRPSQCGERLEDPA